MSSSRLVSPFGHMPWVLETALADETSVLPGQVREMGAIYLDQIATLTEVIMRLANELKAASKTDDQLRRLCTIPGIGPVTAGAVAAFAPDLDTFDSGRNFAAWLGLVPPQRSTGGKTRLGSVSKMGQTYIRRLLIVGAMSVIRWVVRKGGRGRCAGKQDGPDDLGANDKGAGLQNGVTRAHEGQRHDMAARPG